MNFATRDEQTIIALCTPQGSGAIALLRLSGSSSIEIADKISNLKTSLSKSQSHTIHYGHITSHENIIDEVLFLLMRAPNTFTGEDTVEITCHNNPFIIEQIINIATEFGARRALPGEFSKRSVLNGKMDLIQAEGIHEVISAQNEVVLKQSMSQMQGSLSSYFQSIEHDTVKFISYVEACFEFLDEEQRDLDLNKNIQAEHQKLLSKVQSVKSNFSSQKILRDGVRVAIIGSVNAGKSTLFNALVSDERAIVTNIPGTTRDSIEVSIHKDGNFWTIVDTAGLRETDDIIEQMGIEKSFKEAKTADIVLLVFDASEELSKHKKNVCLDIYNKYKDKTIVVANKVDLKNAESFLDGIKVSAKHHESVDKLLEKIENKIQKLFLELKSPYLLNKRQYSLLSEVEKILKSISINDNPEYELISYSLKDILEILSELTGKNINEKIMDEVFNGFCVGK